jgi:hypothetical protein
MAKKPDPVGTPKQGVLPLSVDREVEIDGVGMGVLSDGTAYLTGRGLARFAGVDAAIIYRLRDEWDQDRPRIKKIREALDQQGLSVDHPCITIPMNGQDYFAYSEAVCMAVLEYYAFEAQQGSRDVAIRNYRLLARRSFRDFVYTQTGYNPASAIPLAWKQFQDRVSLVYDRVPDGYFSVYKEVANMIVTWIQQDVPVGNNIIPDISIGQHWSKHWVDTHMANWHGERMDYRHDYPDYFPQAKSNPQKPYCYPEAALPDFRAWMRETYYPSKMPAYVDGMVKRGAITSSLGDRSLLALGVKPTPKRLKGKNKEE